MAIVAKVVSLGLLDDTGPISHELMQSNQFYRSELPTSKEELNIIRELIQSDLALAKICFSLARTEQDILRVADKYNFSINKKTDDISKIGSVKLFPWYDDLFKFQPTLAKILTTFVNFNWRDTGNLNTIENIRSSVKAILTESNVFTTLETDHFNGINYFRNFLVDLSCIILSGDDLLEIYNFSIREIDRNQILIIGLTSSGVLTSFTKLLYGAMIKGNITAENHFNALLTEEVPRDHPFWDYYELEDEYRDWAFKDTSWAIEQELKEKDLEREFEEKSSNFYRNIIKHLENNDMKITKMREIKKDNKWYPFSLEEDLMRANQRNVYSVFRNEENLEYQVYELINNLRFISLKLKEEEKLRQEEEEMEPKRIYRERERWYRMKEEYHQEHPDEYWDGTIPAYVGYF